MSEPHNPFNLPDPNELSATVTSIAARSQELLSDYLRQHEVDLELESDSFGLLPAFIELTASWANNPAKILDLQMATWQSYLSVWQRSAAAFMGVDGGPVGAQSSSDRRFKDAEWDNNPFFDFIKQTYLVAASAILSSVEDIDDVDEKTATKIAFFTKQFVDAVAPNNFAMTNPEVLRATIESGGKNLLDGLQSFLNDIDPKDGSVRIKMVDTSAFELGKNVAVTPGKVVFQNELMQLIQYEPSTSEVFRRPLLIVPPWINKYYILDLQEKNSFIKWAVAQGHTIFVISWVNPDEKLADKDFPDYVFEGPLAALDAIEKATGEREVNAIGYCLGGTLLGATLAYLRANNDNRIQSATLFTALLDFSEPGDIGVFIDEEQIQSIEKTMSERGYLDGAEMASTFNMLRSSDLIWSFVINNYLLGKEPVPFDLLYWNSDATRMPAKMHSTYLRKMYLENAFREPGGVVIGDVPIDLSCIEIPAYFVSSAEDHIAPWKTTFLGAQLFSGPVTFVLSKSGHIAGIINPPGTRQYGHFTGPEVTDISADEWFAASETHDESWWTEWSTWIEKYAGEMVSARVPGDGELTVIEPAPGSFAKLRIT
ncbi:MAG: polyhydroxyalkanoate synthase [Gammaproteobacteria bacterium]|jgi:polyhydroxyalkanoate synthase